MRNDAKNVRPSRSSDARDKLLAALNWPVGKMRTGPDYRAAPMYFDACWAWYQGLSGAQADLVSDIVSAWSGPPDRKKAAEAWAEGLPPAPRCPL